MSLRRTLILLISGLTLSIVVFAGAVAYVDVRQSAIIAVDQRLGRVVEQLVSLVGGTTEERSVLKQEVAADLAVRAALRNEEVDPAFVVAALAPLRSPNDSGLPIQIWDPEGRTVFSDLSRNTGLSRAEAPLTRFPAYSSLRIHEGQVRYWSTVPVLREDGGVLGWVVQERRMGNVQAARQIEVLIGPDARVMIADRSTAVAATLSGEGIPLPVPGLPRDSLLSFESEGRALLARAEDIPGSPWAILVAVPRSSITERPAAFLRRMSFLAFLLIPTTIAAAWAVGRRLTDPIEDLVEASESLARGDYYSREVSPRGTGDELDRLAAAFNQMSRRVSMSHAELQRRLQEEQALGRELEKASTRADAARREAQEASRAKSDFLATMSHEVRTPINAIIGYCDLLEEGIFGTLSDVQREKIERIQRSCRILGALVEDVLDFSHMDAGRMRVESVVAPVRDAVLSAGAVLEPQAAAEGLSVEIDVPPDLHFAGDPRRVEQILMNLLSNAVKFTDEGGVTVRARAEPDEAAPVPPSGDRGSYPDQDDPWARSDGWVRIDVEDTGRGIPQVDRARIFEPFVQGDSGLTREQGGAGLGLSISRTLARMMGGDLTVTSRLEEGSCFTLWLRAAPSGVEVAGEGRRMT